MVSLGFDADTIQSMMTIMDEHKQHTSEASYVKMCNALKYLHDIHTIYHDEHTQTLPHTSLLSPQTHIDIILRERSAEIQRLTKEITYLESLIKFHGRICNYDRVVALTASLDDLAVPYEPRPNSYRDSPDYSENRINELKTTLFAELAKTHNMNDENITYFTNNLNRLYLKQKKMRVERFRVVYKKRLDDLQNQRRHLLETLLTP